MSPSRIFFYKLFANKFRKNFSVRNLSLLECRSKELLQKYDVNIQKFKVINNLNDVQKFPETLSAKEYVVKAQIHAGGRGRGHFDNGFKSGVHLTKDPKGIAPILEKMLGHRLITKQTPENGIRVNEVMVAESVDIKKETYFCILLDRAHNGPVIIASPSGGTDIENVAEKTPNLIKTIPLDITEGITNDIATEIASFLEFNDNMKEKVIDELKKLWEVFVNIDAIQLEINPLVQTADDRIIALDAKVLVDDNAAFRQVEIFDGHDYSESDPKEVLAVLHNLSYISMEGNIGCLVNGAGLAMATMDIIKLHGGEPANFLDVGGNVNEDQVYEAFKILLSDSKVKSILVNVFGGIVNCGTIAKGIINATKNLKFSVPLIVRLEGTNVVEARQLLENSKLGIHFAENLDQAAQKAVQSVLQTAEKVTEGQTVQKAAKGL